MYSINESVVSAGCVVSISGVVRHCPSLVATDVWDTGQAL